MSVEALHREPHGGCLGGVGAVWVDEGQMCPAGNRVSFKPEDVAFIRK